MYTLENFYKSKEWKKCRRQVIDDRMNDDDVVICEICGKPIINAYDIIGHHEEELTEDNVNDAMISLNPENIRLVHHKCHNLKHNKFGRVERKVYLVYGSPCSGKSTYVGDVKEEGDLVVDIDSVWQCVSGCERYVKPNRLKSIVFGVRDELLDAVKYRRGKWLNAYIIGGYPFTMERERLCAELGAEEIFIDTPKEECLLRVKERFQDKKKIFEWERYISDWWKKYNPPTS